MKLDPEMVNTGLPISHSMRNNTGYIKISNLYNPSITLTSVGVMKRSANLRKVWVWVCERQGPPIGASPLP
jgi:hypothetical protein